MTTFAHHEHGRPATAFVVLAGGRSLDQASLPARWQGPEVQGALDSARAQFGHALCLCRTQPLKLQIRMRDGHYHLAVWPQEGPLHDSECAYFRDEISHPPEDAAAPATPDRLPALTGTELLPGRVHYTLALASNASGLNPISLRTLAIRLWERASLCRWHPTWTRDWGRARYELLKAACELAINGSAAEQLLFVPRPYRPAAQDALNREWEAFVRSLSANCGSTKLLIAPVRRMSIGAPAKPPVIHLRHLRQPIGLSHPCREFLLRDCKGAVRACAARMRSDDADTTANNQPEVVGIFIVEGSSRSGLWARAGWLLPVHSMSFIPAANSNVVRLIDTLIAHRHAFQHLLSEVPPMRRTGPDWLVRHVWGPAGSIVARAALEVLDPGSNMELLALRAGISERMRLAGVPTWTWVPQGPGDLRRVPPLPPKDSEPRAAAAQLLDDIASSSMVDYRFGASRKFEPAIAGE
jgi:hypothetical protein